MPVEANGQLRTININLNGFGSVTVNVLDANSNPVSGASVTLQTGNINHNYTASTNTSGVASFPSVFAGSFFVSATNPVNNLSGYGSGTVAFNGTATVTVACRHLLLSAAPSSSPMESRLRLESPSSSIQTTDPPQPQRRRRLPIRQPQPRNYSVNVHDAAGILRASANNISCRTMPRSSPRTSLKTALALYQGSLPTSTAHAPSTCPSRSRTPAEPSRKTA